MAEALRVLYVTAELAPWAKVGGLGDVAQGLPPALARAGVEVRVLVPAYRPLLQAFPAAREVAALDSAGSALPPARLREAAGAVPLWLLDAPDCFDRAGTPYQSPERLDWPDNHRRFGLLGRAAAVLAGPQSPLAWRPHLMHCHDWQSGLAPAFLAYAPGPKAATVSTIHNLSYQGLYPPAILAELGLPRVSFALDGLEFYGHVSFLKAALRYSAQLTTVSPTYAQEIQQPALGFGLDGELRRRAADLTGILNGIDVEEWNPAKDPYLAARYDAGRLERKAGNKTALQEEMGLPPRADLPLLAVVSRLVEQKGIDLVIELAPELARRQVQLAVLGAGMSDIEERLAALAQRFPGSIAVRLGYDEGLAHRIEAGADVFLMPSRFEPSGLNQLYSMRYGTPPVVSRTGGLADSVVDASEANLQAGVATGFVCDAGSAPAFAAAVFRALALLRDPPRWRALQRTGMTRDFSWTAPAQQYLRVYRKALAQAAPA